MDYGTTLMGHHSLWQCGSSYLRQCSEEGLKRLEVLLLSLPLSTEARINKIIDIARESNLPEVGQYSIILAHKLSKHTLNQRNLIFSHEYMQNSRNEMHS